jgi:hypothetical protein
VARIPCPWPRLQQYVSPRKGDLVLVLGHPHAGKSLFSLAWALEAKVPTTLVSLDTSLFTQGVRAAAILSGIKADTIREHPSNYAQAVADQAPHVRVYDMRIDPEEIAQLLASETQFWGEQPTLLILDNAGDLVAGGGFDGYRELMVGLRDLARQSQVCIFALHHTRKAERGDENPIPKLWDAMYAGDREADIALGIASSGQRMLVYVLKNRGGMADVAGGIGVEFAFNRDNLRIGELNAWHEQKLPL